MIKYSNRAIRGLAFLFRSFNDIEVYVEDTLSRNMYEILFDRMLEGRARVQRVFQLGGKHAVIQACAGDQVASSRRRLYIIDGDFELLVGTPAPNLKYLYRLSVYSAENLILTEKSVIEVSVESLTNKPKNEIRQIVHYDTFIQEVVLALTPLFLFYAGAYLLAARNRVSITFKTANYPINNLYEDVGSGPKLSAAKVRQRIKDLENHLVTSGFSKKQIWDAIDEVKTRLPTSNQEIVRHIPGKTYLLPYLYQHLRRTAYLSGPLEQLKVRLARHCELHVDEGLLSQIISTSRG